MCDTIKGHKPEGGFVVIDGVCFCIKGTAMRKRRLHDRDPPS